MSETLFKEVRYTLGGLINGIAMGQIGLPDIQRPFVWSNAKVRDLFDSMYRGYPDGCFLFYARRRPARPASAGAEAGAGTSSPVPAQVAERLRHRQRARHQPDGLLRASRM